MVNGREIGKWSAIRKERVLSEPKPLEGNPAIFRYACHVEYTNMAGYTEIADFDINHRFGDGALILAAKVLAKGNLKKHRRPERDLNESGTV